MHINLLADKLRAALPAPIWNAFRKVSNAVLAPIHFSLETGHLRSSLASRAMTAGGDPIPWFTYPAVQFLMSKSNYIKAKGASVLEWGAGQSTLFWANIASRVVSMESDQTWAARVSARAPNNVEIHLVGSDASGAAKAIAGRKFDIVVCDGLDRWICARDSIGLVNEGGAVIIDNSDGNQGPRAGFGFIELYRDAGFSRVDFYGYPPGNTVQHCTSLLFRGDCFLLSGATGDAPRPPLSMWS